MKLYNHLLSSALWLMLFSTVVFSQRIPVPPEMGNCCDSEMFAVNFPAGSLPSGTYIYRLSAAGREVSRTMQIVH